MNVLVWKKRVEVRWGALKHLRVWRFTIMARSSRCSEEKKVNGLARNSGAQGAMARRSK